MRFPGSVCVEIIRGDPCHKTLLPRVAVVAPTFFFFVAEREEERVGDTAAMKVTVKTMDAGSRDFELADDVSREYREASFIRSM